MNQRRGVEGEMRFAAADGSSQITQFFVNKAENLIERPPLFYGINPSPAVGTFGVQNILRHEGILFPSAQ